MCKYMLNEPSPVHSVQKKKKNPSHVHRGPWSREESILELGQLVKIFIIKKKSIYVEKKKNVSY